MVHAKRVSKINNNNVSDNKMKDGNCYIDNHYGSKLLVKAKDIIYKDEQIVLDQGSMEKYLYVYQQYMDGNINYR